MKFSQQELKKHFYQPIEINEVLSLKDELQQRNSEILDVSAIHVEGLLSPSERETVAHLRIQGSLTLPSTRSLTPVVLPLDFTVDEIYLTQEQAAMQTEVPEDAILLTESTVDLVEAVTDYLLLAIPSQILTPAELAGEKMPTGDAWQVMTEEEYQEAKAKEKMEKVDPRLAKLSEFFQDEQD